MVTAVTTLIRKIRPLRIKGLRSRLPTSEVCVSDFLEHLRWLRDRHCKKARSAEYLTSEVFRKPGRFHEDVELVGNFRAHLEVAVGQFERLAAELRRKTGVVTSFGLRLYGNVILEYLHDLRPIVERLERHGDPGYEFFSGERNYHTMAWELFLSSRLLAQSPYSRSKGIDDKSAPLAAVFMLRQALELKFARLVGVVVHDKNSNTPRLRHDFHYQFIKAHLAHYEFVGFEFALLDKIYGWCSSIVHTAALPFSWQLPYAHQLAEGLFVSGKSSDGVPRSLNGGVRIRDTAGMQQAFVDYFVKRYEHGTWCLEAGMPEALCEFLAEPDMTCPPEAR